MPQTKEDKIPLAEIKEESDGMFMRHNMPCPICLKNYALCYENQGIYLPCNECRKKGYLTLRFRPWLAKWLWKKWLDKGWFK